MTVHTLLPITTNFSTQNGVGAVLLQFYMLTPTGLAVAAV